ncbi:MAG: hypothetical protein U0Y68_02600 [Blastocatellia bacterium]
MKILKYKQRIIIVTSALFLTSLAVVCVAEEKCLKSAWEAFNKGKNAFYKEKEKHLTRTSFKEAISFATECTDNFRKEADQAQSKLDKSNVAEPPVGAVDDKDKDRIFKQGLLNDVATAYFVKGRAAEYLYQLGGTEAQSYKDMAQKAYAATCRYKHARAWDPKDAKKPEGEGTFWSPCEAAKGRLPLD